MAFSNFSRTISTQDEATVWEWNSTVPVPHHEYLHRVFETTARRSPNAPAVCAWDESFTYASLNHSSSKLASYLTRLGVGQEAPVILSFEKSAWAVVATLAVLKAGGAFVPVNAGNADERTRTIVQQTKAHVVLTQDAYASSYVGLVHKPIVVDRELLERLPDPAAGDYDGLSTVRQAAYIIFTSGSTGTPKGVIVEHEAATTSVLYHGASLKFSSETRQLQFSSYVFDMSVTETFCTLLYGGCLCVPSETQRLEDLAGAMATMRVNAAIFTPTVARYVDPSVVPALKSVTMGAEMVTEADMLRWRHLPRLAQGYGPTECAGCTHTNTIIDIASSVGTIGTATGCVGWIVDPENDQILVPIGDVGELAIESHTLARGYLNDIIKTDAAFIHDPAWLMNGSQTRPGRRGRLYKTGDLVRYNPDGTLHIIGRKDTQVKIRGQRVELGEIEVALKPVFPNADSIVAEMITPAGSDGPAQLAAFVSHESDRDGLRTLEITADQRQILNSSVRPVHRPAFFFSIDMMPTTPSGKCDRKRLRELASTKGTEELLGLAQKSSKPLYVCERETGSTGSMSSLSGEDLLRKLWSDCLHVEEGMITPESDFFTLGGSSISVIELIAAARKHGIHWKMSDVFDRPVLAQQVELARPADAPVVQQESIPPFALIPKHVKLSSLLRMCRATFGLRPQDIEDIYPSTPAQEHLMTVSAHRTHAFTLQLGMRVHYSFDADRVQRAVDHVASALPLLRTRLVKPPMGSALQVVMRDTPEWRYSTSLQAYLQQDSQRSIDFGDPLARFGLVRDPNETWLILTLHHALWDRWTLPLILERLGQAYAGQELTRAPFLKDFVHTVARMDRAASDDFWSSYLAHPTWNVFPRAPTGVTVPHASRILRRSFARPSIRVRGITLSVLLRATWAILHSRASGSDDVIFGTTVFGRNCPLPGVEGVVGPTIATVPVRVLVPANAGVRHFLESVSRGVLDSAQHEHAWLRRFAESSARKQSDFELNTLFVVQPREHQRLANPFNRGDTALFLLGGFDDHVLLVQCEIFADRVVVTANYDPRTVREEDVRVTLERFEGVAEELASGEERMVRHVAADAEMWRPPGTDPKELWWRWLWCCLVIYGTTFLYGLDLTIVATLQNSIVTTFGSVDDLTWIGMGFPLGSLVFILPVGYLYGLFENRRLYAGSILILVVGLVLSGAAPNMDAIIAGRVITGAGGGGMYLGALNAIGCLTKRRERTVYAALTGFFYGIGVILGPIIGGALASSSITWRWGFYVTAIVAGFLMLTTVTLPSMEPRPGVGAFNKLRRMDWVGTLLFAGVSIIYSVMFSDGGSTWSWLNARTFVLLGLLIVGLVILVLQQYYNILTSQTWKIFPTEYLGSRALLALFIATAASTSALYITTYYTPLIFQFTRSESPISASVRIIPLMGLFIFAVVLQGVLMPRLGPYAPWYWLSGIFILVGGALMCTVTTETSAAAIQGYTVLIGLGGGLGLQAAYAITTAKVKGGELASAISFINVAQIGSGVLSLTIAGAVYQNIGLHKINDLLAPSARGSAAVLQGALTGLQSGHLLDGTGLTSDGVATALTETISDVFILVPIAGAVVLLCGVAMPLERLFFTKKLNKASPFRFSLPSKFSLGSDSSEKASEV